MIWNTKHLERDFENPCPMLWTVLTFQNLVAHGHQIASMVQWNEKAVLVTKWNGMIERDISNIRKTFFVYIQFGVLWNNIYCTALYSYVLVLKSCKLFSYLSIFSVKYIMIWCTTLKDYRKNGTNVVCDDNSVMWFYCISWALW